MRKLWYAGATLTGGIFLFGAASPAQADLLPDTATVVQQADQRLDYVLAEPNGAGIGNPLRDSGFGGDSFGGDSLRGDGFGGDSFGGDSFGDSSFGDSTLGRDPIARVRARHNSADLDPILPGQIDTQDRPQLPKADVVGALREPDDEPGVPLQRLPFSDLIGNAGRLAPVDLWPSDESGLGDLPWTRQTEAGAPLLGGLGGLLPEDSLPRALRAGTVPDTSGLPGGGLALFRPDAPDPAFGIATPPAAVSATGKPTADQPQPDAPAAAPDDPRLHEEPIDGEHRSFSSDARPVAGVDREFN